MRASSSPPTFVHAGDIMRVRGGMRNRQVAPNLLTAKIRKDRAHPSHKKVPEIFRAVHRNRKIGAVFLALSHDNAVANKWSYFAKAFFWDSSGIISEGRNRRASRSIPALSGRRRSPPRIWPAAFPLEAPSPPHDERGEGGTTERRRRRSPTARVFDVVVSLGTSYGCKRLLTKKL